MKCRYEHCIGTSILCGRYYDKLIKNSKQTITMSDEDVKKYRLCVVVAGLLHDIGHCTLGHSYPQYVKELKKKEPTEHEEIGVEIIQRMLKRENLKEAFRKRGLGETVVIFFCP